MEIVIQILKISKRCFHLKLQKNFHLWLRLVLYGHARYCIVIGGGAIYLFRLKSSIKSGSYVKLMLTVPWNIKTTRKLYLTLPPKLTGYSTVEFIPPAPSAFRGRPSTATHAACLLAIENVFIVGLPPLKPEPKQKEPRRRVISNRVSNL